MQIEKNIIFYFDSGNKIGSGHYGRCLRLSEYLNKYKKNLNFFFVSKDQTFKKNLKDQKINFIHLKKNIDIMKIIEKIKPQYIIIDSYKMSYGLKNKLYKKFNNTIIIDDEIRNKQIGSIYINYNYEKLNFKEKKILKFDKIYIGHQYFFMNLKFINYKKKFQRLKNVLIYFGSTENVDLISKVLKILKSKNFKKFKINIVIGKYDKFNYKKMFNNSNFSFYKNLNNENFLKLANSCQIAIGSGGVSCYERIFLKVVNLVIITAKNQKFSTNKLDKLKYIYKLGEKNHVKDYDLRNKLFMYLESNNKVKKIFDNINQIKLRNYIPKLINHLKL